MGPDTNIGAGAITCNYDGYEKHFTDIGAGVLIGSNTAMVAPVVIGDGAVIGAGSVITGDVAEDALALSRAEEKQTEGGAREYRARKQAAKSGRGEETPKAATDGGKGTLGPKD